MVTIFENQANEIFDSENEDNSINEIESSINDKNVEEKVEVAQNTETKTLATLLGYLADPTGLLDFETYESKYKHRVYTETKL